VYGIKSKKHIIIEGVAVVHKMGMVHSLQIIVMNSFDIHCDDNNTEKRRKKILEQFASALTLSTVYFQWPPSPHSTP